MWSEEGPTPETSGQRRSIAPVETRAYTESWAAAAVRGRPTESAMRATTPAHASSTRSVPLSEVGAAPASGQAANATNANGAAVTSPNAIRVPGPKYIPPSATLPAAISTAALRAGRGSASEETASAIPTAIVTKATRARALELIQPAATTAAKSTKTVVSMVWQMRPEWCPGQADSPSASSKRAERSIATAA